MSENASTPHEPDASVEHLLLVEMLKSTVLQHAGTEDSVFDDWEGDVSIVVGGDVRAKHPDSNQDRTIPAKLAIEYHVPYRKAYEPYFALDVYWGRPFEELYHRMYLVSERLPSQTIPGRFDELVFLRSLAGTLSYDPAFTQQSIGILKLMDNKYTEIVSQGTDCRNDMYLSLGGVPETAQNQKQQD